MTKITLACIFSLQLICSQLFAFNAPAMPATGGMTGIEMAQKVAEEGMVLLKNKSYNETHTKALPLEQKEKIALFGVNQIDYIHGGGGSGNFAAEYYVSLFEALSSKEGKGKLYVYRDLVAEYQKYFDHAWKNDISYAYGTRQGAVLLTNGELALSTDQVKAARRNADTAIITIGRAAGESADRRNIKGDFQLSDAETDLIAKVRAANFAKIIVVLNITGVMDTSWFVNDDDIDAVLLVYLPGMVGGHAMADVLCGDAYPSGKLVDTWAKEYKYYPSSNNFGRKDYTKYEEDIFVGYRYFETIPGASDKVNYEFGYGLSYADFEIGNADVRVNGEGRDRTVDVSVEVTNRSKKYSGKEVVQVYYSAPEGLLTQPARELAAFVKTKELGPGASQTVTMNFPFDELASYDDVGKTGHKAAYVLEPGTYRFYVGNSVRNAAESGTLKLNHLEVAEQLANRMVPNTKNLTKRLTADGTFEPLKQTANAKRTPQSAKDRYAHAAQSDDSFITFKEVVEYINENPDDKDPAILTTFVSRLTDEEAVKLTGCTVPRWGKGHRTGIAGLSVYGLPIIGTSNGPAGIQYNGSKNNYETTSTFYPCATMQASTWNNELVQQLGAAIGAEARYFEMSLWQAPGMNIHRDPLCGRNFEYFSEDPLITGKIGAAITRGVQSQKFASQIKHFACNNQEAGRWGNDSQLSERALREIYLKGYEITVKEANPWSVMSAYNKINGVQTSGSVDLLTEILRNEWGFDGFVMTDFRTRFVSHAEEIIAGNDLKAPADSPRPQEVLAALKDEALQRWQINLAAERVLKFVLKTQDAQDILDQPFQYSVVVSMDHDVIEVNGDELAMAAVLTWDDFKRGLKGTYGQSYKLLDAGGQEITDPKTTLKLGMKVLVTAEDGVTSKTYKFSSASLALKKPAKASFEQDASFVASKAIDGNDNTRWSAYSENNSWGNWIEVDLGNAYHITDIDISFYKGGDRTYNYEIWTKAKESSDWEDKKKNRNFATAGYHKILTGSSNKVATPSDEINQLARYVAVKVNGGKDALAPTINELEVFGWRLDSAVYEIDESARTVKITKGDTTTDAMSKLELIGSAGIEFGGDDTWLEPGEKITVTDLKGQKTEYTVKTGL